MESMQENLLTFVKANPGQRADQIAGAIGSDVKTIRLPMQKLLASRKVKTQGQRRGMTYYAGAGGPGRPAGRSGKGKARKGRARARK
jgi:predicted ArsR family transcriptional regulator